MPIARQDTTVHQALSKSLVHPAHIILTPDSASSGTLALIVLLEMHVLNTARPVPPQIPVQLVTTVQRKLNLLSSFHVSGAVTQIAHL